VTPTLAPSSTPRILPATMRTALILALAVALGVLVVSQWSYLEDLTQKQRIIATSSFPIVGEPAPSFDLPALDGDRLRLADYAGRPVIVYFWTTWCTVCKHEMPLLVEYYETQAAPIPLVSICSGRTETAAREVVTEFGLGFPVGYDEGKAIASAYQPREEGARRQITAFPFLAVIDADGTVLYALAGRCGSVEELVSTLERLELLQGQPEPALP